MVYQDIVEDRQITVTDYRPYTYYVHGLTDVVDFLTKDRNRFQHPGRYLEPYLGRRKTFAYFSRTDVQPFLSEAKGRLRRFISKKGAGHAAE
jgi:hypothetical protein